MIRDYFSNIPLLLSLSLFFIYFLLFGLERIRPLRKRTRPLLHRMIINVTFSFCVYFTAILLISPVATYTMQMTSTHAFGLLQWFPMNTYLNFILGFMLLDLTFYYWHRLNHEWPLLWRFHNVHHIDPDLDVTTSMRFHVVEIAYSSLFRLAQLGLIGVAPITLFLYELVFQANTFFHHSNVRLPLHVEKILNKVLVTPRMHGVHHSAYLDETNRNYSVVFSVWDRLHKTIKLNIPQQDTTVGVPAYLQPNDNTLVTLLIMPFKTQRRYWRFGDETYVHRVAGPIKPANEMVE